MLQNFDTLQHSKTLKTLSIRSGHHDGDIVVDEIRAIGAFLLTNTSVEGLEFDMDKLAWPFAMLLPTIAPDATYELANNHMWRTEFAFRKWYTPSPPFIAPPSGGTEGGEREWIEFTLGMYYTLLDCGFRLPPSAGTAARVLTPMRTTLSTTSTHSAEACAPPAWPPIPSATR